jgi:phytol kinase
VNAVWPVPPWLGPALVAAWLSLLAWLAKLMQQRWPDQPEWSRKLVHIGSGPVVLIAWFCGIEWPESSPFWRP